MAMEQRRYRLPPFGSSAPLIPFTSFPDPLTVEGQVRRPAELPHVSLIALGGLWRPLGGRQVLAQRSINPVTVQDLTAEGVIAETIGPFPGGLVRAGMSLIMTQWVGNSGIGTGLRVGYWFVSGAKAAQANASTSGVDLTARVQFELLVQSDSSAAHISSGAVSGGFGNVLIPMRPVLDFSANWSTTIRLQSGAETAITITGATWSAGVATYTTSAAHTLALGDKTVVSGISPAGWNTTAIVSVVPDTTHFSVPMVADPGAYTGGASPQSSRISNMKSQSYLLELVG